MDLGCHQGELVHSHCCMLGACEEGVLSVYFLSSSGRCFGVLMPLERPTEDCHLSYKVFVFTSLFYLLVFLFFPSVGDYLFTFKLIFFSFLAAPQHMDFPGQGADPSHICHLCRSCSNTRSFNLLCQAGDGTCVLELQRCH